MNYRNKDPNKNKYGIPFNPPAGYGDKSLPEEEIENLMKIKNMYRQEVVAWLKEKNNKSHIWRSVEEWNKQEKSLQIKKKLFSPRLYEDLKKIELTKNLPPLDILNEGGLYIWGKVGTGKTIQACNLLVDIKKHLWLNGQNNWDLKFISLSKVIQQIKNSYNNSEITEMDILGPILEADVLVVDDIGVQGKVSDWLFDILYQIVNYRYEQIKFTIYTSNMNLNKLGELLEDYRIPSRIGRSCIIWEKQPW